MSGATVRSTANTNIKVAGLAAGNWYGQVRAKDTSGNFSSWTPVFAFSMPAVESGIGIEDASYAVDLIADYMLDTFDDSGDVTRKFAGMLA